MALISDWTKKKRCRKQISGWQGLGMAWGQGIAMKIKEQHEANICGYGIVDCTHT